MTIDEINILNSKLRELTKLIPNDEYISNLYESNLKEKHKLEAESLDIRPTKRELSFYMVSLNRKLKDNGLYIDEVINFIKTEFKRNVYLQNRKIQLCRTFDNSYNMNSLQTEANNLINTMIFEDFLVQYKNQKHETK